MSLFEERGVGIVLTDVFVSATAALLIVLAVAQPSPPAPLPIQADIAVTCRTADQGEYVFQILPTHTTATDKVLIRSALDFAVAVHQMNMPAALLYKVAVIGEDGTPLASGCLQAFKTDVVWPLNAEPIIEAKTKTFRAAVFSVTAGRPLTEGPAPQ